MYYLKVQGYNPQLKGLERLHNKATAGYALLKALSVTQDSFLNERDWESDFWESTIDYDKH